MKSIFLIALEFPNTNFHYCLLCYFKSIHLLQCNITYTRDENINNLLHFKNVYITDVLKEILIKIHFYIEKVNT